MLARQVYSLGNYCYIRLFKGFLYWFQISKTSLNTIDCREVVSFKNNVSCILSLDALYVYKAAERGGDYYPDPEDVEQRDQKWNLFNGW